MINTKNLENFINFDNGGYVFATSNKTYDPSIIKNNLGQGITAIITNKINPNNKLNILKAINQINDPKHKINFIYFTTGHPNIKKNDNFSMIYLYSNYNDIFPIDFNQAKDLEKISNNERIKYLKKLTDLLEIPFGLYNNWTTYSVSQENGLTIYRFRAINLNETKGIGLLYLNPLDGFYLYSGKFDDSYSSMQFELGTKTSEENFLNFLPNVSSDNFRLYTTQPSDQLNLEKNKTYNSRYNFIKTCGFNQLQIGVCIPQFLIKPI